MAEPIVLLVDDDPLNLDILLEALEGQGFLLETAQDGQRAWEMLLAAPTKYSAIILDRMMPRLDGLALLKIIKSHPVLRNIPVIMQTAAALNHQILEGLQAGAYYYLTKPYDFRVALSIVRAALRDGLHNEELRRELQVAGGSASLLRSAHYQLQTLTEAHNLALSLSHAFPEPQHVVTGLEALLNNAIEHGNLGIGYKYKAALEVHGGLAAEVARRQALPENASKWVDVYFRRDEQWIIVEINDQGSGFDWQPYLEVSAERALSLNGRGIALARSQSFDELVFENNGSRVVARTRIRKD